MRLKDRTIIITGASSGIGAATALACARQGARLVLGARRGDRLEELASAIRCAGGEATFRAGDVTDADFAADLVALAEAEFGGLDAAFNNAGTVGPGKPVAETGEAEWAAVMAANLTSAYRAAHAQVPALMRRGGGSILFTGSFVGYGVGLPGMGAYAASKAGIVGLVQVLASELGAAGIRANALLPGGTKTEMAGDDPAFHDWAAGLHALRRLARTEEIAAAAVFLLSDEASFVTGSAMAADGGNSVFKA